MTHGFDDDTIEENLTLTKHDDSDDDQPTESLDLKTELLTTSPVITKKSKSNEGKIPHQKSGDNIFRQQRPNESR